MTGVDQDDIERMENYVLLRNLRGYRSWTKEITDDRNPDYAADMETRSPDHGAFPGQMYRCVEAGKPWLQEHSENIYGISLQLPCAA